MNEELISEKLNEVNSLTDIETGKPTIPVIAILQEAKNLYEWCLDDKDALVRAGLDWKLVEDLPLRTDALKTSQSKWRKHYKSFEDCQEEWKIASPAAFNLRDELVHYFYHVFHTNKVEYAKVQRIDMGGSNADMLQDLLELSDIGKDHTAELEAVGMDLTMLDTARTKSFELATLLAKVNKSLKASSPFLDTRNKAYTHLKEATDEIRRIGQFVFWRDENKYANYVSQYSQKQKKVKKIAEEPAS